MRRISILSLYVVASVGLAVPVAAQQGMTNDE